MTEAEQRKADRRAAMPISSEWWDAVVREFGLPEWFRATENNQLIDYTAPVAKRD